MPPKGTRKSPRKSGSALSTAAITDEMRQIPSRISTNYGSDAFESLKNPLGAKRMELDEAVQEAVQPALVEEAGPGSMAPPAPPARPRNPNPAQDPLPELVRVPPPRGAAAPELESELPPRARRPRRGRPVRDPASPDPLRGEDSAGSSTEQLESNASLSTRRAREPANPHPVRLPRQPESESTEDSSRSFGGESVVFRNAEVIHQKDARSDLHISSSPAEPPVPRRGDQPSNRMFPPPGAAKTGLPPGNWNRNRRPPSRVAPPPAVSEEPAAPSNQDRARPAPESPQPGAALSPTENADRSLQTPLRPHLQPHPSLQPNRVSRQPLFQPSSGTTGSDYSLPAAYQRNPEESPHQLRQRPFMSRLSDRFSQIASPLRSPFRMTHSQPEQSPTDQTQRVLRPTRARPPRVPPRGVDDSDGEASEESSEDVSEDVSDNKGHRWGARGPKPGVKNETADLLWQWIRPILIVLTICLAWMVVVDGLSVQFRSGAYHWYGLQHPLRNLGQFVPFRLQYQFGGLDPESREYVGMIRKTEDDIFRLQQSNALYSTSLQKLDAIVPKVVHLKLDKKGRPIVSDEFWHALRDLIKEDPEIVTIKSKGSGTSFPHWATVQDYIDEDLKKGKRLSRSWELWMKDNRDKVVKSLGLDKPIKLDKGAEATVTSLIKEQLKNNKELSEKVVTKEEFLRVLKSDFTAHRKEIKDELKELKSTLEKHVEESIKAALEKQESSTHVSKAELKALMEQVIQEKLSSAQLGAFAGGKVHHTYDSWLSRQPNFFNVGLGANINVAISSPTYGATLPDYKFGSKKWLRSRWRGPPRGHGAVLTPWEDEGDEWCGTMSKARDGDYNQTEIAIRLGRTIYPEYVVVEHIVPGATLSPGARPDNVEVWAQVDNVADQARMVDFSYNMFLRNATRERKGTPSFDEYNRFVFDVDQKSYMECFPPPNPSMPEQCFFLIGSFRYETRESHGGSYVYMLSRELLDLGVVTDQVKIVAKSNFGDAEKTCFYRLRLYGQIVPEDDGS